MDKKQWKINNRNKRDIFREKILEGKRRTIDCFKKDPDIKNMKYHFSEEFYREWDKGFESYIRGDWGEAIESMEKT